MLLLGIIGQIGSGKGEVAKYLVDTYGFVVFSLAHIVHEECADGYPHETVTRELLQNIGDNLRLTYGKSVLAERVYKKAIESGNKRVIIDGIRNDGELLYLKKQPSCTSIAVVANQKLRFKRVISRDKKWDPKDWESFLKIDERDYNDDKNPDGQHVGKCLELADFTISNNGDLESLYSQVDKVLAKIDIYCHAGASFDER